MYLMYSINNFQTQLRCSIRSEFKAHEYFKRAFFLFFLFQLVQAIVWDFRDKGGLYFYRLH